MDIALIFIAQKDKNVMVKCNQKASGKESQNNHLYFFMEIKVCVSTFTLCLSLRYGLMSDYCNKLLHPISTSLLTISNQTGIYA